MLDNARCPRGSGRLNRWSDVVLVCLTGLAVPGMFCKDLKHLNGV